MATKTQTVRLLVLSPSQNDAESLVSMLRNTGKATRAHRILHEDDLLEALKGQVWDLCVARQAEGEFGHRDVLAHILRLDKDIPFILLSDQYDPKLIVETMKLGAVDVVPVDDSSRLILVIERELRNLEERRRRRALDIHLREAEKRCQLLLESSMDAIAYVSDGMHVHANQAYLRLFGYEDLDELMCIPLMDTVAEQNQDDLKQFLKQFSENAADANELRCVAVRGDGTEMNVQFTLSAATYDGEPCTQVVVRQEQDDSELEERLKIIATQDLLTGLFNKQHFIERLQSALERALRHEFQGALLYISLDQFSRIKMEAGIAGADLVLSDVANLLQQHSGEQDVLGRLGDDTFAILLPEKDDRQAQDQAEQLRKAIELHLFEASGRTIQCTCSIGIVLVNDTLSKAEELLARAHQAAAHVHKLEGHELGNGVYLYHPRDFEQERSGAKDILIMLEEALENNRFRLLFQPIISLRGDSDEHYEAFLRMLDDQDREISPNEFLPIEGRPELAIKLDRWVILQNIKSLSSHRSKGHSTRLFLNITPHTILDKTFLPWLSLALKAARLPGDSLIFQINEEHAITHLKQAKEFSQGLKQLHCKVSLNRFGCALNPFNTLKHVEVDYVKLDGSFTEEIQKNEAAREKVKEMIKTLHASGKLVIVPLVESASVLSTLWQAGVNYIQGYYLQAPTTEMNYVFNEEE